MIRRERTVELRIMCNYFCITHERRQLTQRFIRLRSVTYVVIVNVSKMRNLFRNRFPWINKRDKPINYFAALHTSRRNLRQFIMVERETRSLRVDNHNIVIEFAKITGFSATRQ